MDIKIGHKFQLTSVALMNMFQGIKIPMPWIRKMKYTK